MNVQLDLILPPIVLGILLVLILSLNRMMMESQTGNRLNHEMQLFANTALLVLQEELRDLDEVVTITDSTLVYLTPARDTVRIRRDLRDLVFIHTAGVASDTTRINARLANLNFNQFLLHGTGPMMLRVRVETESSVDQEIGGTLARYRAFAERDFYLRNLDLIP
jgi:hypothetical protein